MIENQHPYIPCASDETIVWHYFSLSQFLWMIENGRLHFTRADRFEDKYEFLITKKDMDGIHRRETSASEIEEERARSARRVFINCWVMSDHELALMWKSYSSEKEGVAIKSTVKRIRESYKGDIKIYPFVVQYINQDESATPCGQRYNDYWFTRTKRALFEQEKEMRLVQMFSQEEEDFSIEIDLEELIEGIHIAPNAEQWFVDLVKSVCNRYGLEGIPVVKSEMI